MPDDAITKGRELLKQAESDLDDLVDQINAFQRKYPPASVVFGCTLIEGRGAKYAYGGPSGPRIRMGHVLAHIAEDEEIESLQTTSPIQVTNQMPPGPS